MPKSVAQNNSILESSEAGLWRRPSMPGWFWVRATERSVWWIDLRPVFATTAAGIWWSTR